MPGGAACGRRSGNDGVGYDFRGVYLGSLEADAEGADETVADAESADETVADAEGADEAEGTLSEAEHL